MNATSAREDADQAVGLIGSSFEKEDDDSLSGADNFFMACELMASVLVKWRGLEGLGESPPLDEVLAELEADGDLVEEVASLIELAGKVSYGGPPRADATETIARAQDVAVRLEELLMALDEGDARADDG